RGSVPLLPVTARLLDERLEQPHVLARLGMPKDSERKPVRRILQRFYGTVLRPRGLAQAGAERPEALMKVRLHRRVVREQAGLPPQCVLRGARRGRRPARSTART